MSQDRVHMGYMNYVPIHCSWMRSKSEEIERLKRSHDAAERDGCETCRVKYARKLEAIRDQVQQHVYNEH